MKILVTGGAGFIGSHIVDALIEKDHDVFVIDNLSTGKKENLNSKARLYTMDIRDKKTHDTIVSERPDAIFHTAARIDLRASLENPVEDSNINILGSLNILEGARKAGTKKFIFSSTGGAMYGDTTLIPTSEQHKNNPLSPYGITKRAVEHYLRFYHEQYAIQYVSLRYANVYGPRQNSKGDGGVVAIFCDGCLQNEKLIINGDGKYTRDYVFVQDVARANILALESELVGEFNVSTSIETDVNQLAAMIKQQSQSQSEFSLGPARDGDVLRSCLDFTKIHDALGWSPEVNIQDGIARTIEWFKSQGARE